MTYIWPRAAPVFSKSVLISTEYILWLGAILGAVCVG